MTLTAAVPSWLTTTASIPDSVWEWIVFLICRAGKRRWCSVSTRAVATALGRKEDTGTRLARAALATGLVARHCQRDATLWVINTEALLAGKLASGWQPAHDLLAAVIADHTHRAAYVERERSLSDDIALADHRLACFTTEDYGGEEDLLALARRRDQARHAIVLATIESERFQRGHGLTSSAVGDRMLADRDFATDWRRHDGIQQHRQDQYEWLDAEWNELRAQTKDAVTRARKLHWEHRKNRPATPDTLLRQPLACGTYSLTPRGLMTRGVQQQYHLRDASGVRRLMMVLLSMAKGARTYDTTIEAIAERMGRHRETIGKGLRVLHDARMIGLGYLMAKTHQLQYAPTNAGIRVSWGKSASRMRGVRLTMLSNKVGGRDRSELGTTYLDMVVYKQPRRTVMAAEAGIAGISQA